MLSCPGEQPCIGRCSDLNDDCVSLRGLEGHSLAIFVQYLTSWTQSDIFLRIYGVFGDEFLLFLASFQGETLKLPPIRHLKKVKISCQVYSYLQVRGFSEQAYIDCEKTFGQKRPRLESLVAKVEHTLRRRDGQ